MTRTTGIQQPVQRDTTGKGGVPQGNTGMASSPMLYPSPQSTPQTIMAGQYTPDISPMMRMYPNMFPQQGTLSPYMQSGVNARPQPTQTANPVKTTIQPVETLATPPTPTPAPSTPQPLPSGSPLPPFVLNPNVPGWNNLSQGQQTPFNNWALQMSNNLKYNTPTGDVTSSGMPSAGAIPMGGK